MLSALPIQVTQTSGRAILRALPQPLYDTEVTGTNALTELDFFRNQQGTQYANLATRKTLAETNMLLSGQIATPQMFDLYSFNVKVNCIAATSGTVTETSYNDFMRMFTLAYFEFDFANKPFLQVPLQAIPEGVQKECCVAADGSTAALSYLYFRNGTAHVGNTFRFTISAKGTTFKCRIMPTESFGAKIVFNASVTMTESVKVSVYLNGILYNSI